jgi:hypothetical protein
MRGKLCPQCDEMVPGAKASCKCGFKFFWRVRGILVHSTKGTGRRRCPNCKLWIHLRHKVCACGHDFNDVYNGIKELLRLPLDTHDIELAKMVTGGSTFRETMDHAAKAFLPIISKNLKEAGFRPHDEIFWRTWPVSVDTVKMIDDVAASSGTSRVSIVRALIALCAQHGKAGKQMPGV